MWYCILQRYFALPQLRDPESKHWVADLCATHRCSIKQKQALAAGLCWTCQICVLHDTNKCTAVCALHAQRHTAHAYTSSHYTLWGDTLAQTTPCTCAVQCSCPKRSRLKTHPSETPPIDLPLHILQALQISSALLVHIPAPPTSAHPQQPPAADWFCSPLNKPESDSVQLPSMQSLTCDRHAQSHHE